MTEACRRTQQRVLTPLTQAWSSARAGEERARVLAIIAAAAETRFQLLEVELREVQTLVWRCQPAVGAGYIQA